MNLKQMFRQLLHSSKAAKPTPDVHDPDKERELEEMRERMRYLEDSWSVIRRKYPQRGHPRN